MGQAVSLFEHPDERVALKLKEITCNSCRCIKKQQSKLSVFFRQKIFHLKRQIESLRRRFNANRKKVHNVVTWVKLDARHSNVVNEAEQYAR